MVRLCSHPMLNLNHHVARLHTEGGSANRLVLSHARGWVLLTAQPGSAKATIQVADGRHLSEGGQLPEALQAELIEAGYRRRSAADPWVAERAAADVERIAAEALRWAETAFGAHEHLDLQLGVAPRLENAALHERMEAASRTRDLPTRNRLYHGLVRARFIVPLTEPAAAPGIGAELALRTAGQLHGEAVAALFTDWETLTRFDPRGLPVAVFAGMDIFPLLASRRFVSVLINPTGQRGGELYRHEIDAIAEGCRRLQGAH